MASTPVCGVREGQGLVLGALPALAQQCLLFDSMKGKMGLFLSFFSPKNFTALIPGTTVEILHGDSNNIIQLIVNAYSVSHGVFPLCHLPQPAPAEAPRADVDSVGHELGRSPWLCLLSLAPSPFCWFGGDGRPA